MLFSALQKLLGHLWRGEITLVYGEPGSGKTTLALFEAVYLARKGYITLYVDADGKMSTERLAQIASDNVETILPLILVTKPDSLHNLTCLLENLGSYITHNTSLLIVDSITALYRKEMTSNNVLHLNRELNLQIAYLTEVAKTYGLSVLLTSQAHTTSLQSEIASVEPVATRVLRFWSQNVIRIFSLLGCGIKELEVEKSLAPSRNQLKIRLTREGYVEVE